MKKCYYSILDVEKKATPDEIKQVLVCLLKIKLIFRAIED